MVYIGRTGVSLENNVVIGKIPLLCNRWINASSYNDLSMNGYGRRVDTKSKGLKRVRRIDLAAHNLPHSRKIKRAGCNTQEYRDKNKRYSESRRICINPMMYKTMTTYEHYVMYARMCKENTVARYRKNRR